MNATMQETRTPNDFDPLKIQLKTAWMAGDYDLFSRFMERGAGRFFQRLGVTPRTRLLDVGCGAGQLALIAARAGARVTGCDIATNWLEKARLRAAGEGLQIAFEEGDAQALPHENGQFDVVASLMGAMFAPRPARVAAELTRVCRRGGVIAMGNWTPGGFMGQLFRLVTRYTAPDSMPAPTLWGNEANVRERLREGIADLRCTSQIYRLDYPFPPEGVVEFFRSNYGPVSRAFASLDKEGRERLRSDLVGLWSAYNRADDDTTAVDAEYLEMIAIRN